MADKEKYFIPIEGKLIEVEKNVYVAYYKMDRRERYLEERDKDNGVVSYNTIDSQGIDGKSGLQDVVTETMERSHLPMNSEISCIGVLQLCQGRNGNSFTLSILKV